MLRAWTVERLDYWLVAKTRVFFFVTWHFEFVKLPSFGTWKLEFLLKTRVFIPYRVNFLEKVEQKTRVFFRIGCALLYTLPNKLLWLVRQDSYPHRLLQLWCDGVCCHNFKGSLNCCLSGYTEKQPPSASIRSVVPSPPYYRRRESRKFTTRATDW